MKIFNRIKRTSRRAIVGSVLALSLLGIGIFAINSVYASNVSINNPDPNCDNNAVVWCGVDSTDQIIQVYNLGVSGHDTASSIQNIYGYFGINRAAINAMPVETVVGSVTKSGDVYVGSRLVATNALTAGRQDISGSTERDSNGTIFYERPPSVSFLVNSIPAFVVMQNNEFKFAILGSCGNPVVGTPIIPPQPNYQIQKQVEVSGSNQWSQNINVKSGAQVTYRVVVASTGNVAATNIDVRDSLPADVVYTPNSLVLNGNPVSASDANLFFHGGLVTASLAPKAWFAYYFNATVDPNQNPYTCVSQTLNNQGIMTATGLPTKSSTATVNKTCLPLPTFACNSLTDFQNSRTEFTYTAKGSVSNGASVVGYIFDFGDGSSNTVTTTGLSASTQHNYAQPGTYTATAYLKFDIDGHPQNPVTSAGCTTKVTVVPAPAAECTDLTLTQPDATDPSQVVATAKDSLEHGAELSGVSFNWGDGNTTPNGTNLVAQHDYQQDGNYTIVATLTFTPATVAPSTCQSQIQVVTTPPTCDSLNLDVDNSTRTATISSLDYTPNDSTFQGVTIDWGDGNSVPNQTSVDGLSHTYDISEGDGPFTVIATVNFSENGQPVTPAPTCQYPVQFTTTAVVTTTPLPTVITPTALTNTGPGNTIGLFAGVTIFGAIAHRIFRSRRASTKSSL